MMMETIWLRFADKLKAFIVASVHDKALADDILQEVFIKIHAHIDKLSDETKIQPWIYQIARNAIADHFRAQNKQKAGLVNWAEEDQTPASDNLMHEAVSDMIKMMDELPPENCEALCLTELEGLSQKAYAEKAGINYSTAKSRVQRSRKMLRDMLMQCCHYQFDKYGTVLHISPVKCCCCAGHKA